MITRHDLLDILELAYLYFRSKEWMQERAASATIEALEEAVTECGQLVDVLMIDTGPEPLRALGEKVQLYVEICAIELATRKVSEET